MADPNRRQIVFGVGTLFAVPFTQARAPNNVIKVTVVNSDGSNPDGVMVEVIGSDNNARTMKSQLIDKRIVFEGFEGGESPKGPVFRVRVLYGGQPTEYQSLGRSDFEVILPVWRVGQRAVADRRDVTPQWLLWSYGNFASLLLDCRTNPEYKARIFERSDGNGFHATSEAIERFVTLAEQLAADPMPPRVSQFLDVHVRLFRELLLDWRRLA